MKEYINVIIQGIVQGFTEFLPISSSGHLSVLNHFIEPEENSLITMIVLHLGTLLAVFIAFRSMIWEVAVEFFKLWGDIFKGKFSWKNMNAPRKTLFMLVISTAVLIPFYFFKDFFTSKEQDDSIIFEGCAFLYTAVLLFLSDLCAKGKKTIGNMTVKDSFAIGLFQVVALFPGVSRSGSTVTAGLFSGLTRESAVAFSFLLGIPAILGGSVLELGDAVSEGIAINIPLLIIGFITAAVVGILSIWLVKLIAKKDKFRVFGVYTAILGVLCIIIGIYERNSGKMVTDFFKELMT